MIGPYSIVAAVVCLLLALGTAAILGRFRAPENIAGRFAGLDGLRGYLAFFVFLHHTTVWYEYVRVGRWDAPKSALFTHFGQSSVALFFMITGLLFWSKLLDARSRPMNWLRLYVSRVLRLTPLYLFAMLLLGTLVLITSGGKLHVPLSELLVSASRWVTFTITGAPDINAVPNTFTMIAYVTWSLKYEWLFYLTLPLLALLLRVHTPLQYVGVSALVAGACVVIRPELIHLVTFGGGIVAAHFVRSDGCRRVLSGRVGFALVTCTLCMAVLLFDTAKHFAVVMLLSLTFLAIASGNTFGGLLTTRTARILGEISYGIYLLHGFVLFVAFELIVGRERASMLSPTMHWTIAALCTPIVVLLSYAAFRTIEAPSLKATERVTAWFEQQFKTTPRASLPDR